jgi:acetyl-CoA carboxylase biotin carboxyl carrier protein
MLIGCCQRVLVVRVTVLDPDCGGGEEGMSTKVVAEVTGLVWKIEKSVGEMVDAGDVLLILESMKMELPLEAPVGGKIAEIRCKEGQSVSEGDVLVILA